jgi:hypothetical protein
MISRYSFAYAPARDRASSRWAPTGSVRLQVFFSVLFAQAASFWALPVLR